MTMRRTATIQAILVFLAFLNASLCARACTIFVLTDGQRTLFFNNEDWSNPNTRLWFVPAGKGYYGCAYVGFDNGWAQGGLNTEGLAFDWVAGFAGEWKPRKELKVVRGNPSERMLETCSTVEEAITFYRANWEPDFARSRILIADRTGASVILGARNGELLIEKTSQCRGFGYARQTLVKMLTSTTAPTLENGARILRASLQEGEFATKYSNVFDLKSGDIVLITFGSQSVETKLNLDDELKKGAHYYDIPRLREQVGQPPKPLLREMQRFWLDELKPIPDNEPHITAAIRKSIQDAASGSMRADDYAPEFWNAISSSQKQIQADLERLGTFQVQTLVGRSEQNGNRSYFYRLDFTTATVLQRFVIDSKNKISAIQSEGMERKPAAIAVTD